jgi:hypothetical protein
MTIRRMVFGVFLAFWSTYCWVMVPDTDLARMERIVDFSRWNPGCLFSHFLSIVFSPLETCPISVYFRITALDATFFFMFFFKKSKQSIVYFAIAC